MGAYKEPVTITTVLPSNAVIKFEGDENYDKNPWYDQFKEKFNIDVKNLWVAGTDYKTKLNLSIADGSLPDAFIVKNVGVLNQLIDGGVVADLTDIFETYASEDVKSYMQQDKATFDTGFKDGRMYGIPQLSYGIIDQPNQVWIRKDWKEEQKLEDPKTIDDLINIIKTFKKKYQADGMGECQTLNSMTMLAPAWGAYPSIWLKTANGIEYGSVQPEMKDVLSAYTKMYKEGCLYTDFTTADSDKMLQTNISGKVGVQPFAQWWGWAGGTDVVGNLGKDAYFQAYKIPSANGKEVKVPIIFANYGYVVVNKKCKNPEAVLKLINYFVKAEFKGDETKEVLDDLVRVTATLPYSFRVFDPQTDYNQFRDITQALQTNDTSKLLTAATISKYDNILLFKKTGDKTAVGTYLQQGDEKCAYSVAKSMLDSGNIIKDVKWGGSPQTLTDAGSTLDDLLTQGFTQIIVGEQPIEYFDKLVKDWKTAGGEQATNEMNKMYGNK